MARAVRKPTPPTDREIFKTEAAALAGISVRTLDAWVVAGTFPQPRRFGTGPRPRPRWLLSEILRHLGRTA
jgi:predicted DNA-binding transcriptional regulator AlpA